MEHLNTKGRIGGKGGSSKKKHYDPRGMPSASLPTLLNQAAPPKSKLNLSKHCSL